MARIALAADPPALRAQAQPAAGQQPAATQPPATPAQTAAGAPGGQAAPPPVMRFDPAGVDITEAVRVTLQNSPDIRIAQTNALQAAGFARQQAGAFDTTLTANANHTYQRQNLTPNDYLGEVLKRQDLRDARDEETQTVNQLTQMQTVLTQAQSINGGQGPDCSTDAGRAQMEQLLGTLRKLDYSTASDLQVIDILCRSANQVDPTQKLRNDLLSARNQLISDTLVSVKQGVTDALNAEARLNRLVVNLGAAPDQDYTRTTTFNVTVSRLFRNGISFSPFFKGTGNSTNYIDKPFNTDCELGPCGGKGSLPLYNVQSGFNVFVPLGRGLGAAATAAGERAALVSQRASDLEAQHQASVSALGTINAYWNLRAAQEDVDIAQRSVELQGRIVQLTQQSITAGSLPPAELARVQASEARAQTTLRDARVALHQARVALATAMGIAVGADDGTLPLARDPFPPPPDAALVAEPQTASVADDSLQRRLDVTASAQRSEAARIAVRGAQLNLKPIVDLTGGTWWTGLDDDVISKALKRWVGPSYTVGVNLEKPFGNNTQRGLLIEAQAGQASSAISEADLRRQVRLNIVRTTRSIAEVIERVRLAQAAVGFYQQTIDAEIQRYQIGEATLIDTIFTESQQADARRSLVAAQQELAQLIAEYRFETGTLIQDPAAVTPQTLITLPQR